MHSPIKYARLRLRLAGGSTGTRTIQVRDDTDKRITGFVVDREGNRTNELVIADTHDVISRTDLVLDLHYGTLVEPPTDDGYDEYAACGDDVDEYPPCPVCGDPIDYCQGHGTF